MMNRKHLAVAGAVAVSLSLFSAAASADTLNATNFGFYTEQGSHVGYNFTLTTGDAGGTELRSFFTFDLSSVTETIGSATLHVWNSTPDDLPGFGYNSSDATETINIY